MFDGSDRRIYGSLRRLTPHRLAVPRKGKTIGLRALFRGNKSRSEIVATFLAVLELCKASRLRLAGTEEDCTVTSTKNDEEDLNFTADSY